MEGGREPSLGPFVRALILLMDFPGGSDGKASAYNVGDLGSITGLGWSPGEGNGTPLQYSCLENPMDEGAWLATVHGVAKSRTRLSDFAPPLWPNHFLKSHLLISSPWDYDFNIWIWGDTDFQSTIRRKSSSPLLLRTTVFLVQDGWQWNDPFPSE